MKFIKYPAGTRYSNSTIYDEATDEIVHGFQVFRQCKADGIPTGRKSFVTPAGLLTSIDLAETFRRSQQTHMALRALHLLEQILRAHESGNNGAVMGEATLCEYFAKAAIAIITEANGL